MIRYYFVLQEHLTVYHVRYAFPTYEEQLGFLGGSPEKSSSFHGEKHEQMFLAMHRHFLCGLGCHTLGSVSLHHW